MTPDPKPPTRSRRAKRLTLRQKKAARPERYCAQNHCYRPPLHVGRCTTHTKLYLDRLQRRAVVGDECEIAAWHAHLFPCSGPIQVNHGIEREYLATRYRLDNVMAGCRSVNLWAHHHRREWDQMLMDWWGVPKFNELRTLAISGEKPDYDEALAMLQLAKAPA